VSARGALATLLLALAAGACHGRPRTWSAPPPESRAGAEAKSWSGRGDAEIAEIDLTRGAPEEPSVGFFGTTRAQSYDELVTVLRDLAKKERSRGILIRFGGAKLGWARAQEVGDLLFALRNPARSIVCHAEGYANTTMWIAARGCDRIWVSPAGEVELIGVAAQGLYAHKLLAEKLGIDVDILQIGKYKGAEETFTRDSASPEARASLESTLAAIRGTWLEGLKARSDALSAAAEDGPFAPEEAVQRGLADAVGYIEQARDEAKKLSKVDRFDVRFGPAAHGADRGDLAELVHLLAGTSERGGAPHVTLVRAVGAIAMDGGGGLFGERAGITERTLGRTLRKLTEDASTKAVVLRIDSPGGSALASDLLWQKLMELRKKKPLVVSIGEMAASGGYYMASTGTRIVAEPTSIVGSIGVVGGKLSFGKTLERVGVHVETFVPAGGASAQARAAYESPFTAWDDATRERVRAEMTAVYDLFVKRVAEGRGLSLEVIAPMAEGRIFAGEAAKEGHLVDEWGGLDRALALARELGRLGPDAPVRVVGQAGGIWSVLGLDDEHETEDDTARAALAGRASLFAEVEEALRPGLQAFLASVLPLARGEHTVTALPFALVLR
jgi:protease IV